jgi:hypothetical protein
MVDSSGSRRLIALLLVALPLHAAAAAVLAPAPAGHACTDHMCRCAHPRRPGAPEAPSACHERADAPPDFLFEHAGCRHTQAAAAPESLPPHVLPEVVEMASPRPAVGRAPAPDDSLSAGFLEIDLPPPRARA